TVVNAIAKRSAPVNLIPGPPQVLRSHDPVSIGVGPWPKALHRAEVVREAKYTVRQPVWLRPPETVPLAYGRVRTWPSEGHSSPTQAGFRRLLGYSGGLAGL